MTKDEALKLALEALENISTALREDDVLGNDSELMLNAITAIKEALAQPEQEAIYGMNPDDWKDLTDAVKKVRDGRGMPLACKPADVFQDWFLWLGTAKIKENT